MWPLDIMIGGVRSAEAGQGKATKDRKRRSSAKTLLLAGFIITLVGFSLYSIWEDNPYDQLEGGGTFYHGNRPYGAQGLLAAVVCIAVSAGGLFLFFTPGKPKGSSLLGRLSEPGLVEDLKEYLELNGYSARVVDKKGPEAIHHTIPLAGNDALSFPRMGVVKVEGHDLEYVEVIRLFPRSRGPVIRVSYYYACVMRAEVGQLAGELNATTLGAAMSDLDRPPSDIVWQGGWLAGILNADGELRTLLQKAGSPGLRIFANPRDNYVAIIKHSPGTVVSTGIMVKFGKWDFPNLEDLAVYDHIFHMIKESMIDWKADVTAQARGSDGKPLSTKKVHKISTESWIANVVLLLLLFSFSSLLLSIWVGIPLTIVAAAGLLYLQLR